MLRQGRVKNGALPGTLRTAISWRRQIGPLEGRKTAGSSERNDPSPELTTRSHPLGHLARGITRHPWYPLILWIVILVVCVLPAANVGRVISGTFSNPLPSSDASVQAQDAYTTEFPHAQGPPSSSIILLESPNILGPVNKNATLALTAALLSDPHLKNVSSVASLYTSYATYLVGQVGLGWSFLGPALRGSPSLPTIAGQAASAVWGPEAAYLQNWTRIFASQAPGTPAYEADWPAYNLTREGYPSGSPSDLLLSDFYNGDTASGNGFNASVSGGCLATENVTDCADAAVLSTLPSVLPALFPSPPALTSSLLALGDLSLQNWSSPYAQEAVGTGVLGPEVGIAPSWLLTIWRAFPGTLAPSHPQMEAWADTEIQDHSVAGFPRPVPSQMYTSFVNPAQSATLVVVSFNVPDTYLVNGTSVTYADVSEIQTVVNQVIRSSPVFGGISAYETGAAPLDGATNYLATSALSLLLALTVVVLLVIMLLYFRSPSAPALAFGMIGIALTASLAVIFLVGTFVTTFNSEIESIVLVFLMSIGTDYSVFLLARYREELVRGAPPKEAVETTVRWAGQSITTSGLAVLVVAGALTLSGISFLSELGIALLIAVSFALVVNLTALPAILALVGPRIFWPNSGARFEKYAQSRTRRVLSHRDPVARAGKIATERPLLVIGLVLALSIPVVAVALEVPVSYDITNIGLPASNPAQVGINRLTSDFGASYSSPSYALVTVAEPLMNASTPNAQEFQDLAGLSGVINATPGVAGVTTLVGSGGIPLDLWLEFPVLPPALKVTLNDSLSSYVGIDGTTVLFHIRTNASGYSSAAVGVLASVQQRMSAYDAAHGGVTKVLLGGAAPTTRDIESLVSQAEEEMLIGASVGLFVIMLAILGSAFVPLLALAVIGLSILWSWAGTYFVVGIIEGEALIFLLPLILLILVLGLGMDYNVLLLTRVKEERGRGDRGTVAIKDAVTHAGGVITAAAVILGGAFLLLGFTSPLGLLAAIGLGIGFAVLLQAFIVQLFFTPAVLTIGKDRIWKGWRRSR